MLRLFDVFVWLILSNLNCCSTLCCLQYVRLLAFNNNRKRENIRKNVKAHKVDIITSELNFRAVQSSNNSLLLIFCHVFDYISTFCQVLV